MLKIVIIHIKIYRNNFFVIVSDTKGKLVFSKSSGSFGFKNSLKVKSKAFSSLLSFVVKILLNKAKVFKVFLKFDAVKKAMFKEIYNQWVKRFRRHKLKIIGFKVLNKIPHNGCRKNK